MRKIHRGGKLTPPAEVWAELASEEKCDGSLDLPYIESQLSPVLNDLDDYVHKDVTFFPKHDMKHGYGRKEGIYAHWRGLNGIRFLRSKYHRVMTTEIV